MFLKSTDDNHFLSFCSVFGLLHLLKELSASLAAKYSTMTNKLLRYFTDIFLINHLIYKMSEITWKCSSLFHNVHVDQQSKTKDYKQANIHMVSIMTHYCCRFCFLNDRKCVYKLIFIISINVCFFIISWYLSLISLRLSFKHQTF